MKGGFLCCGKRTRVARTVNPCTGRVVRYRKCRDCGAALVTVETVRHKRVHVDTQPQVKR